MPPSNEERKIIETRAVTAARSAGVPIPSDALRAVLNLRDEIPLFSKLLEDIIQIVIVLDASAVQGELRWRLGSRVNPSARTGLHEAIDSGAVIAVAPAFLRQEIEKYIPVIASDTGVSVEVAVSEWTRVESLIRFYVLNGDGAEFALVDPKDSPYALTARELDADFVRTTDPHFGQMGVTVMGPEHDRILRDYARATSVLITVKLGSGLALTFGIQALVELIRGIIELILKLPPAIKLLLGTAVAIAVLHPTSREKLIQWVKKVWDRVGESKPLFVSTSQAVVKHLAEAAKTSRTTREVIKSRLRVRGKQTALSHARLVCLRSGEPLSIDEIARRILANGYSSRSKTFTTYVRRVLRQDSRFVANPEGLWMLRVAA
jgi:hypothetical protein